MSLYFDKYAQEGNEFLHKLANDLGHPEDTGRTATILRSVLHVLRDRLSIGESMHLLSQLPMFLKAVYVEDWKYSQEMDKIKELDEFLEKIKNEQKKYGEKDFPWDMHTEEIVRKVFHSLEVYLSKGEIDHIKAQLPENLIPLFEEA